MSNKFNEEILKSFYELLNEGHEAIVNHEEVEVYENKVKSFLLSTITRVRKDERNQIITKQNK